MRYVVCPRCGETIAVPEELASAYCPRCSRALSQSETHVASGLPRASLAIQADAAPEWTPPVSTGQAEPLPPHYLTWEDFRSLSPAIQSELFKLATNPLPDMRGLEFYGLPENLPPKVEEFAKPLATVFLSGESKSLNWSAGSFIAVIGCFFLVFVGFQFGAQQVDPGPGKGLSGVTLTMLAGIVIIAFGVWYAFIRHPTLQITLWIFENGLLVQRSSDLEACAWEDIKDLKTDPRSGRPIHTFLTRGNCKLVLSPDASPTIMPLAEYIGVKVASAQLLPKLRRIFEDDRVKFGVVTLDRVGMSSPGFFARWADIQRVVIDESNVFVDCRDRPEWHAIPYRDVSFPQLLLAIAHVLIEDHHRFPPAEA